jgi:1-acyl-sn-glycerol-3-phosphate acyltransferase
MIKLLFKIIYICIFKLKKWKIVKKFPKNLNKAIVVCAPHTSNWDSIFAMAGFFIEKIDFNFAIKKEAMFFPIGFLLKKIGAIPIDRTSKNKESNVKKITKMFDSSNSMFFLISPEGTRKYNEKWKTGFYYIALEAKVPIILAFLDYEKKEAGFQEVFVPTGNIEKDIEYMKNFYKTKKGKYPERGII